MTSARSIVPAAAGVLAFAGCALGDIGFDPPVSYFTPQRPAGVVAADLNGNGHVDLAVATDNPDKISVMFNNGDGTFGAPINHLLGPGVGAGALVGADFNGDGHIDLAVALQNVAQVRILVNNGVGGFVLGATAPTGANPRGLITADLNGDGKPDLAAANRDSNTVSVLINQGAGTFISAAYPVGNDPRAVGAGDRDGDGDLDLFVTNHDDRTISILNNNGAGVFTAGGTIVAATAVVRPEGIVAADLNKDGMVDLAVALSDDIAAFNAIGVFINNGGSFGGPTQYPTGGADTGFLALGDFDNDGNIDIAATNEESASISVLAGNGAGGFGAALVLGAGTRPEWIAAGDFDKSGSLDLAVSNRDSDNTLVYLNKIEASCYPDCDGSGALNIDDFVCFQLRFALGDPYADCDGNGVFNIDDFICFQLAFALGC